MIARLIGALALSLVVVACGTTTTDSAQYRRIPVPSTPFTVNKLDVDQVICAEKGKTLACSQDGVNTDCWCEPRDAGDRGIAR